MARVKLIDKSPSRCRLNHTVNHPTVLDCVLVRTTHHIVIVIIGTIVHYNFACIACSASSYFTIRLIN